MGVDAAGVAVAETKDPWFLKLNRHGVVIKVDPRTAKTLRIHCMTRDNDSLAPGHIRR